MINIFIIIRLFLIFDKNTQIIMNQITLITLLSAAIVFFILRPIYMKDIVDYKFKTLADILAFLFLSWVVGTVLGLLLAMNLAP